MNDRDDFELLEAWRDGDRSAGDELFGRHFAGVFRFFRNKLDEALAEDLTQTTFLACADSKERFRQHASFRTFLFGIARNHLYMHYRKRGRHRGRVEFMSQSVADLGAGPETIVAAKAEQRLLLQALRQIPVDFQIAVELYYWEGLSTREVAEVLEVPEGTVRSRLTRAREHLARQMKQLAASAELVASTLEQLELPADDVHKDG